jgi:hypothetical protein
MNKHVRSIYYFPVHFALIGSRVVNLTSINCQYKLVWFVLEDCPPSFLMPNSLVIRLQFLFYNGNENLIKKPNFIHTFPIKCAG